MNTHAPFVLNGRVYIMHDPPMDACAAVGVITHEALSPMAAAAFENKPRVCMEIGGVALKRPIRTLHADASGSDVSNA